MTNDFLLIPLAQILGEGENNTTGGDEAASTAQDGGTSNDAPPEEKSSLFDGPFLLIMIGMVVLWIFLLGGGSRKQKKKQAAMLASISKGSKVVTIGGIKGSVVEVRDDEVLVKVDESANTRLRFSRDAIRSVTEGSGSPSSE